MMIQVSPEGVGPFLRIQGIITFTITYNKNDTNDNIRTILIEVLPEGVGPFLRIQGH